MNDLNSEEENKAIEHYLNEEKNEVKTDLTVRVCRTCGETKSIWSHERCKECYFKIRKWENEHRGEAMRMTYHEYKTEYPHCRTALGSYSKPWIVVFVDEYTFFRVHYKMSDIEAQAFMNYRRCEKDSVTFQILEAEVKDAIKKTLKEEMKKEKENGKSRNLRKI